MVMNDVGSVADGRADVACYLGAVVVVSHGGGRCSLPGLGSPLGWLGNGVCQGTGSHRRLGDVAGCSCCCCWCRFGNAMSGRQTGFGGVTALWCGATCGW